MMSARLCNVVMFILSLQKPALPAVAIHKVTWENIEFLISQQPKRDATAVLYAD